MTARKASLNPDRELQAYVIGLAIGDGNLSNPNGRAVRLRITCDTKYPRLVGNIFCALRLLLPDNRVSFVPGKGGKFLNISVYSNHLESLLGWKAAGGSKHRQQVCIPQWIFSDQRWSVACLRGLIESDGCIYKDRGYTGVNFSTVIPGLAHQVHIMMEQLGFQPRTYCVPQGPPAKSVKYQVRLCRDVHAFLALVRPVKV